MTKKVKILLVNSYSFEAIYENWQKGINPSHFLMGKIELDMMDDFEVVILKHEKYRWLNKLGNWLKLPHLDQQIRALLILRDFDLLYLPYPMSNSRLITTLKLLRIISTPIVVLLHQAVIKKPKENSFSNWLARKSFQQYDAYACFSHELLRKTVKDLRINKETDKQKFFHIKWGADSLFYKKLSKPTSSNKDGFAVCAGTQDRDFDTVIEAFKGLAINLKIYCTPSTAPRLDSLPDNVTVDTSWVPYTKLLEEYVDSTFIIIPIKDEVKNNGNTLGLTVLLDAIALGKPVAMTYHPYIDIDIEQENIGKWVVNNDVAEWKQKLRELSSDREGLITMGTNAKNLYLTKYNSTQFANEMADLFSTVIRKKQ